MHQVEKKYSALHVTVQDYRDVLNKSKVFYKLYDDAELWVNQKTENIRHLNHERNDFKNGKKDSIVEIELILKQIDQNIDESNNFSETKVKKLSEIAAQIEGMTMINVWF